MNSQLYDSASCRLSGGFAVATLLLAATLQQLPAQGRRSASAATRRPMSC